MRPFTGRTDAYVLLTIVDVRSMNEATDALVALRAAGVPTLRSLVRLYKAHRRARASLLPVSRVSGEMAGKANPTIDVCLRKLRNCSHRSCKPSRCRMRGRWCETAQTSRC